MSKYYTCFMSQSRGDPEVAVQPTGRERQRGRTRKALLAAAAALIAQGRTPSVTEVADAAEVSRRTAYRYFPTPDQLLVEAALEGLRPGIVDAIEGEAVGNSDDDVEQRLDRTVRAMQQGAVTNEALLRMMIRLTVSPSGGSSVVAGQKDGATPRRGYRRIEWIELALAPVRAWLGKRRFERLVSALAVCIGIDALIVLRDLRGLSVAEAEAVARWSARTLLRESLADATSAASAEAAIRGIIAEQVMAWNCGDAHAWAKDFSDTAAFVNILGMPLNGRAEIDAVHAQIFRTLFRGSRTVVTVNRVSLLGTEVAVVGTEHNVTGYNALPPGIRATTDVGSLTTRMLYVLHRSGMREWKIVHGQNTAMSPETHAALSARGGPDVSTDHQRPGAAGPPR